MKIIRFIIATIILFLSSNLYSDNKNIPILSEGYDKKIEQVEEFATGEILKNITPDFYKTKNIPKNVDADILGVRKKIKNIFYNLAKEIETKGKSGKLILKDGVVSYENIKTAQAVNNITLRSIKLSFDVLSTINKTMVREASLESDINKKRKLYINQAILVYEMSSLVIEIANEISLDGTKIIESIKKDTENEWENIVKEIDADMVKLEERKKTSVLSSDIDKRLKIYNQQKESGKIINSKWTEIQKGLDNQQKKIDEIRSNIFLIEVIQKQAKIQMRILRDVKVIGIINESIGSLEGLINIVKNIPLLEIDKETMKDLIGNGDYN